MAVNKVVINGTDGETVLIDLTEDTVTPETLLSGVTAHNKSGEAISGTIPIIKPEQIGIGQQAKYKDGYTIEKGYHDGTGKVSVVSQEVTVTPSKSTKTYPGTLPVYLSKVTVNPIPDEYQDVRNVTATEDGVELGKVFVDATGAEKTGTFTIDAEITEQDSLIAQIRTALAGKTAGGGSEVPMQEKTVSITENGTHEIVPDAGYTLSKAVVNVNVEGAESIDGIPAGYARCDYIYFNIAQIVDTGVICNQNTKIRIAFARERSAQHYLFGVASSGNTASVTAYLGGSWRFGNKSATKTPTTNADMIYSGMVDKSQISITGSASTISSVNDFETVGSLLLGACRGADGSVSNAQFQGKVFHLTMWQGEEQVLKLVPVTDGTAYRFFDLVSKTFFDSITDTALEGGNL